MTAPKLDTLQNVELAEGVQIRLRPAGPGPRGLAFLLDLLFIALGIILWAILALFLGGGPAENAWGGLLALLLFLWFWGYFIFFEVLRGGRTPGKKIMNLRVVRTSGARVGWGSSIMRNLIRFADMMPLTFSLFGVCLFGLVACLATRRFQRLGDLVADTVVVYDKTDERIVPARLRVPVAPVAPPLVLTREEQQAFTLFLERASMWSDARKEEMVASLAEILGPSDRERVERALAIGAWIRDS